MSYIDSAFDIDVFGIGAFDIVSFDIDVFGVFAVPVIYYLHFYFCYQILVVLLVYLLYLVCLIYLEYGVCSDKI